MIFLFNPRCQKRRSKSKKHPNRQNKGDGYETEFHDCEDSGIQLNSTELNNNITNDQSQITNDVSSNNTKEYDWLTFSCRENIIKPVQSVFQNLLGFKPTSAATNVSGMKKSETITFSRFV